MLSDGRRVGRQAASRTPSYPVPKGHNLSHMDQSQRRAQRCALKYSEEPGELTPSVTSEDHGSMEQKHRPEIGRSTWTKARTKMKLSGYLCAPSPAFSRLVGQGASLPPHGSASMVLEYHDPL